MYNLKALQGTSPLFSKKLFYLSKKKKKNLDEIFEIFIYKKKYFFFSRDQRKQAKKKKDGIILLTAIYVGPWMNKHPKFFKHETHHSDRFVSYSFQKLFFFFSGFILNSYYYPTKMIVDVSFHLYVYI